MAGASEQCARSEKTILHLLPGRRYLGIGGFSLWAKMAGWVETLSGATDAQAATLSLHRRGRARLVIFLLT